MRWLILLLVLGCPLESLAGGACETVHPGLPTGPLGLSFFDGDIGRPRRACPRSEVALSGSLLAVDVADDLIVEDGNFYATMAGGGELSGSWRFSQRGELFATLEAIKYRYVQNATLIEDRLGLGFLSLGATWQSWSRGATVLAVTGRITLPTAIGYYENAWPMAADFGLALASRPWTSLSVHAQAGGVLAFSLGSAEADPRAGVQLVAGLDYTPLDWLGLVLQTGALLGYRQGVDRLDLAAGFRFRIWEGLGLELAGMLPWAGASPADLALSLRVSYRLDGMH